MTAERMCGLAASAWRLSRAALGSLNARGAVLFVPRMLARAFKSSRRNFLNRYTPYSAKPMLAAHSATTVLIIMTSMSLRRSESLRVQFILVIRRALRSGNDLRQRQQLGTDFQMRAAGGPNVNGHPHPRILDNELDHSAGTDEIVHVRHGQDARSTQRDQNGGYPPLFRIRDEQDVAGAQIVGGLEFLYQQLVPQHVLALRQMRQLSVDGALSDKTDHPLAMRIRPAIFRPFHKFKEVKQVGRLDLKFRGRLGCQTGGSRNSKTETHQQRDEARDSRPAASSEPLRADGPRNSTRDSVCLPDGLHLR